MFNLIFKFDDSKSRFELKIISEVISGSGRNVFFRFSYPEKRVYKARYKVEERKFLFGDHFDPTFGIETYIRLNVDTRINRSISDKIDGAVKIFIYF